MTATSRVFTLAESPVWDAVRRRLLWVDIIAGTLFEGALQGNQIRPTALHHFRGTVGAVAVAVDGTLLVATQDRLIVIHPDGGKQIGPRVVPAGQTRRLNDGSTDPAGRFLVGTLSLDGPSDQETLVRLEHDGRLTVLDDDLTLSNGLAWSADGQRMYSVDTLRRTVFVRDYDPETGVVGPRSVHLLVEDGFPDGMAMDVEDNLWLAIWGAGEVRCYSKDGMLRDRVLTGAPHTSSVAFAGEDLRTLVVTTATAELDRELLRTHPDSGRLFTTRTDVAGLQVSPWSGSTGLVPITA